MVSGKYNRVKGATYERELVKLFRNIFKTDEVRRGLQYRSGVEMPDVECPVLWIEAKRMKQPNIRAALRQAQAGCPKGRIAAAITKANRSESLITMELDDFLEIFGEWWRLTNKAS